jgi:ABC transporter substrate binding protein
LQLTEIYRKGFGILISTVPAAKRIAVLYNPDTPSHIPGLKALEESAHTRRVQLQAAVARAGAELESAFTAIARAEAQAVFVLSLGAYSAARQRMAELAIRHRLPTMFADRDHVEAGGLMSYGADLGDLFRRGAIYVDISKHVGRVNRESIALSTPLLRSPQYTSMSDERGSTGSMPPRDERRSWAESAMRHQQWPCATHLSGR